MEENEAKEFAEEKFKQLPELNCAWNALHSKYIIVAIEELSRSRDIDLSKLRALAWVYDIGKIEGDENHAEKSIKILKEKFSLDSVDEDCILNHGSSGEPKTKEGKIFQAADGISLFYPEILFFTFYANAKEGKSFEEIKGLVKERYEKHLKAYSEFPEAIEILKRKCKIISEL